MSALAKHRAEVEFFREHPGEAFDEGAFAKEGEVEFAVEPWAMMRKELQGLIEEHWNEIALDKDIIKLDPNWDAYNYYADHGELHCVTARVDECLIGYHLSFIHPHIHYKNSLTAFADVMYLCKPYRKGLIGYKLIKTFVETVRARGVQKIYHMTKENFDLDPLLRRLGFKPIERVYTRVFR